MTELKPIGRPFSVLSPDKVAELVAEYKRKPFNISERERNLGLPKRALYYHLSGGKVKRGMTREKPWRVQVKLAAIWVRKGEPAKAAEFLRKAAEILDLESTPTKKHHDRPN